MCDVYVEDEPAFAFFCEDGRAFAAPDDEDDALPYTPGEGGLTRHTAAFHVKSASNNRAKFARETQRRRAIVARFMLNQ